MLDRLKKRKKSRGVGLIRAKDIQRLVSIIFGIIQPCMVIGALCVMYVILYNICIIYIHSNNNNNNNMTDHLLFIYGLLI